MPYPLQGEGGRIKDYIELYPRKSYRYYLSVFILSVNKMLVIFAVSLYRQRIARVFQLINIQQQIQFGTLTKQKLTISGQAREQNSGIGAFEVNNIMLSRGIWV